MTPVQTHHLSGADRTHRKPVHDIVAPKAHLQSSAKDGPRYVRFSAVRGNADFGQFWDFRKIFEFSLAENRCVPIDSDATIGPVGAPWIVWKTLKKKSRGARGLVGQN